MVQARILIIKQKDQTCWFCDTKHQLEKWGSLLFFSIETRETPSEIQDLSVVNELHQNNQINEAKKAKRATFETRKTSDHKF
jgi:hypothetical protein